MGEPTKPPEDRLDGMVTRQTLIEMVTVAADMATKAALDALATRLEGRLGPAPQERRGAGPQQR